MTWPVCSITALATMRNILDIAHAAHRSGAPRRTVHAAGIEFDHAFFVRQAAQADAVVVGIVLRPGDDQDRGIQCVAAFAQVFETSIQVSEPVVGRDDDWTLARVRGGWRGGGLRLLLGLDSPRVQSERQRTERSCGQKIATGKAHALPPVMQH